jgi:hypothetical protein
MSLNKFSNSVIKEFLNVGCNVVNCNTLIAGEIQIDELKIDNLECKTLDVTNSATINDLIVSNTVNLSSIPAVHENSILTLPPDSKQIAYAISPYYFMSPLQGGPFNITSVPTLILSNIYPSYPDSSSILNLINGSYDVEININSLDATGYNNTINLIFALGGANLAIQTLPSLKAFSPLKIRLRLLFDNQYTINGRAIQNYEIQSYNDITNAYNCQIVNVTTSLLNFTNIKQELTFSMSLGAAGTMPIETFSVGINCVYGSNLVVV